ncbi:hypothetical protein [Actinomadura luteofluorescens]|uniref:hypothetical protein n=1 Tax=Actinomadura luteofluorescens TaxID=46163 RepID=UPI003D904197
MNRTLLWVGLSLIAAGLAAGLVPLSSQGVSCGSVFAGSDQADQATLSSVGHDCDGVRSQGRPLAVALVVVGVGLTFGAFPRPAGGGGEGREHRTVLGRPVGRRRDDDS